MNVKLKEILTIAAIIVALLTSVLALGSNIFGGLEAKVERQMEDFTQHVAEQYKTDTVIRERLVAIETVLKEIRDDLKEVKER